MHVLSEVLRQLDLFTLFKVEPDCVMDKLNLVCVNEVPLLVEEIRLSSE